MLDARRVKAWETRRAKYGPRGHDGAYTRMPGYGARSYFYCTHRTCDEKAFRRRAEDLEMEDLKSDDIVFQMIAWNGD